MNGEARGLRFAVAPESKAIVAHGTEPNAWRPSDRAALGESGRSKPQMRHRRASGAATPTGCAARTCFEADHELTFEPSQSLGADNREEGFR